MSHHVAISRGRDSSGSTPGVATPAFCRTQVGVVVVGAGVAKRFDPSTTRTVVAELAAVCDVVAVVEI
jgi:hypothetical protein